MKSRITLDVDHDNQPIIKIEYNPSDDVRDKLVKRFLETFGSESCWARFEYVTANHEHKVLNREAVLRPVCAYDLPEEVQEMQRLANLHLQMRKKVTDEFVEYKTETK